MFGAWKTTILTEDNNYFPEKMFFEDTPTLILWLLTIKDFRIAYEATHFFRQHSASATAGAVFSGKKLDDRIKSSDLILVNAKKMNCYELYKDEFDFYYVFVCLYNTLMKLVENPLDKTTILNLEKHVKKTVPQFKRNKYVKARASFPGYPSWYLMRAAYNNPFIFATIYRALRRVYYCFKR